MTKHYGIVEWMEFFRGLLPPEKRELMATHLSGEGCPDCRQTAAFFEKLVSVCHEMIPDDVPDTILQRALAIWPGSVSPRFEPGVRIPVELIYDSSLAPVPVGLRSAKDAGWRVLYRAGAYSLDFYVEPEVRTSRISLVGQIVKENPEQGEMSNIAVVLKSGTTTIAETLSNQFGEFRVECEQRKHVQLCIYLEPFAGFIEVPLDKFTNDKGGGRN